MNRAYDALLVIWYKCYFCFIVFCAQERDKHCKIYERFGSINNYNKYDFVYDFCEPRNHSQSYMSQKANIYYLCEPRDRTYYAFIALVLC